MAIVHSFFIHTYFDYNKLLTIVTGRKKEKRNRAKMKLHFFRDKCVVAKGAKPSSWPLPQCDYRKRKKIHENEAQSIKKEKEEKLRDRYNEVINITIYSIFSIYAFITIRVKYHV